ncbi:MAG: 3-keto-5-aminohexanoate cleavage protein [Chloroflexi bacterium]|nr:MAG: 3-keto-5-aminohexanoate cleavage protein [Chloroflexota bacterium]
MMDEVIITAALTGAQQGKEANPNLPEQPDEIIQQALDCWRAGAAIVHLHARNERGRATSDVRVFRKIVNGIRAASSDVVINLTTGGAIAGLPLAERIAVVPELKPEIASFSVGAAMVGRYDAAKQAWARDFTMPISYAEMEIIARTMLENNVRPELEVYDASMLNNIAMLRAQGWLSEPLWLNFVMGIHGQVTAATPKNLMHLVDQLPPNALWLASVIGGRAHWQMAAVAMALGGHVRTGLEDNVYLERGVLAHSNAQLVEKMARLARDLGREIATPAETRARLKLAHAAD